MEARTTAEPRRAWRWLDDRLGIGALRYPVPRHANSVGYTLGGITFVSFVLLTATGIYLGQFYDPGSVEEAHTSVFYISTDAPIGSVVRSLHYWLATIFVVTLVLHLLRTFVSGAFKAPREFTWISGVLMFVLAAGALFTGTVLKGDQEGLEALEHNNEIADFFGGFGFWFSGDFTDSIDQIPRLYISHVTIVPALIVALLALHLMLIKRHGISPRPWGSASEVAAAGRAEERLPFTSHLRHIGLWGLAAVGVALVLTGLWPTGLGAQGVEGIEVTKPPWYFLWLYQPENWWGLNALWIGGALLSVALLAVPLLDRSPERDPRRRKPWMTLAAIVVLGWIVLTILGATTELASHVEM